MTQEPIAPSMHQPEEVLNKIKNTINDSGLKKNFVAGKLGYSPSWLSKVLEGHRTLSEENKRKLEELLNIQL